MREYRAEAKTIDLALKQGLEELGLRREQANWRVEQEPKSGFLGIGSKKAIVVVREKFRNGRNNNRFRKGKNYRNNRRDFKKNSNNSHDDISHCTGRYGYEDVRLPRNEESEQSSAPRERRNNRRERVYTQESLSQEYLNIPFVENAAEQAKEVLLKLLTLMGVEEPAVQEARLEDNGALVMLSFTCKDTAQFTSDNGRMLQSLQFMLNTIINKKREPHLALRLDTDGYWGKKEKEIEEVVEHAIACVKASGNVYRLDPMPATMRKLVHTLVKNKYPEMKTSSEGEGRWRKVVISPSSEDNSAENEANNQEVSSEEVCSCGCEDSNEEEQNTCCCESEKTEQTEAIITENK